MPINFAIKLAVTVAMEAAQMGLQASKRTKGPRLDEVTVTVSEYGTPLPRFLGTRKFACPVFHAEDLKEVEKTTKVKGGGKQTTYHYLATFACAIADCPTDKVLKLWFDDKLVYDATGTGPVSYASALGIDLDKVMRVYKGTETQLPDPRYESWCEDKYGPNSAPAYRGVSYLFFEELPVDNFGNRIPQITVLASSATATAYPWNAIAKPGVLTGKQFSPSLDRLYFISGAGFQVVDVASKKLLIDQPISGVDVGAPYAFARDVDGNVTNIYGTSGANLRSFGIDGGETLVTTSGVIGYAGCGWAGSGANGALYLYPGSVVGNFIGMLGGAGVVSVPVGHMASHVFTNAAGASVAVGTTSGNILSIACPASSAATLINTAAYGSSGAAFGFDNGTNYVVRQGVHLFLIDKTSFAIVGHTSDGGPGGLFESFDSIQQGATSFWNGPTEYNSSDLSVKRTISSTSWGTVALPGGAFEVVGYLYDAIDDALISLYNGAGTTQGIILRYLDRASGSGVTLGQIVSAMCDAAKLADRDTSALTQTVQGYSWTRGDVKSQMEPVIDIHDVDARPHDFTIEFLPRGSAPTGLIVTSQFAKGDGSTPRYKSTIAQDTDLPAILRVNFADTGFDQQTNNVLSPLPADSVDTQRDATIDLTTYAAQPAEAQQLADRYMRREWNSRETIENSLTAQCMALEPGDVTTLDLDGSASNVRLTKQTIAGGKIDCTFVRDETSFAAVNSATTGPTMDARTPEVITFPAPIRGFVVDAPLWHDADADSRPLLYVGAGSYAGLGFPGAVIYEATGSPAAYDTLFAAITSGATWGSCSTTLGNVASPWLWDRGNSLTVSLQAGSLSSVTEADINADQALNLILVGRPGNWEWINFTTATLQGDGSWKLSGFKRGRRGTEWACSGHSGGETWILATSLEADAMGTDDVGSTRSFKAQAIGRAIDAAAAIDLAPVTGATLKPYAPANVKWSWDGTNLTGTITRRTRVGGSWNGSVISLGETSEAYEVDIYNGVTFKRTIALSGTNAFTYTAAMAAADGITLPTPPSIKAYQLSSAVGRGFALAA